jgi:hypothetical protein
MLALTKEQQQLEFLLAVVLPINGSNNLTERRRIQNICASSSLN